MNIRKRLSEFIKSGKISFLAACVLLSSSTTFLPPAPVAIIEKYDLSFPIVELGNCTSLGECRSFCDDPSHRDNCVTYAKSKNIPVYETLSDGQTTILAQAQNQLGCGSIDSCQAFCAQESNFETCNSFAKRTNLGGGYVEQQSEETIQQAKLVLGCTSKETCKTYCEQDINKKICGEFAKHQGLRGGEDIRGPGGCTSPSTCQSYCTDPKNFNECSSYAAKTVTASQYEYRGPGGCRSESECYTFCQKNPTECSYYQPASFVQPTQAPKQYTEFEKFCQSRPTECTYEKFCATYPTQCSTPVAYPTIATTYASPTVKPEEKTSSDGTFCRDSDGNGGYNSRGTCTDNKGTYTDYCDSATAKDYYCTGEWSDGIWKNLRCATGGYVCTSSGLQCSEGACYSPTSTSGSGTDSTINPTSTTSTSCSGGRYWNGSSCVCATGYSWNGTSCVSSTNTPYPTSTSSCSGGRYWNGTACVCSSGYTWSGTYCLSNSTIPTPTRTPTPASNTSSGSSTNTSDGSFCNDSDGGNYNSKGTCTDRNGTYTDYCDGGTVRDYYCTGSWNGSSWSNYHCEHGGFVCTSSGMQCSDGGCVSTSSSSGSGSSGSSSPTNTPAPQPTSSDSGSSTNYEQMCNSTPNCHWDNGTCQCNQVQSASTKELTFPIPELGNCTNCGSCQQYCSAETNRSQCMTYVKENGLEAEELAKQKQLFEEAKKELGCNSEDSCQALCSKLEHASACKSFAASAGLIQEPAIIDPKPGTSLEGIADIRVKIYSKSRIELYLQPTSSSIDSLYIGYASGEPGEVSVQIDTSTLPNGEYNIVGIAVSGSTTSPLGPIPITITSEKGGGKLVATLDQVVLPSEFEPEKIETDSNQVFQEVVVGSPETPTGITLSGKSEPNTVITVLIYSNPIVVTVKTDENGNWTYTLTKPLGAGEHTAYIALNRPDGTLVRSEGQSFIVPPALAVSDENAQELNIESADETAPLTQYAFLTAGIIVLANVLLLGIYFLKSRRKSGQ